MPSRWGEQPAAKAAVESFDNFAGLRNALRGIARERGEWAGIPIPIDGERLVIEPSYPYASLGAAPAEEPTKCRLRNTFYSHRWRCDITIFEDEEGKLQWGFVPAVHHLDQDLHTLGCSFAWGVEQESKAIHLLGRLVKHVAFKQYLLAGMFLEKSERSGIMYLFRRLKPTIAMVVNEEGRMRILAALCMHPIGYYAGSWAGAMCPTDDVIAHLMLMRADEAMYWRRANQHGAHRPEAGI